MRFIIGVSGASGIVLAERLLKQLSSYEKLVVISSGARKVAEAEGLDISSLERTATKLFDDNDLAAPIASSSYPIDAMVVVPCSMKTLSGLAHGYADNLIARAGENCLKMGWPLIVVPRETPLSLPSIENMAALKRAGAIILPANVAYYPKPKTIDDVTDFIVGKILDSLKIEHTLYKKWKGT